MALPSYSQEQPLLASKEETCLPSTNHAHQYPWGMDSWTPVDAMSMMPKFLKSNVIVFGYNPTYPLLLKSTLDYLYVINAKYNKQSHQVTEDKLTTETSVYVQYRQKNLKFLNSKLVESVNAEPVTAKGRLLGCGRPVLEPILSPGGEAGITQVLGLCTRIL